MNNSEENEIFERLNNLFLQSVENNALFNVANGEYKYLLKLPNFATKRFKKLESAEKAMNKYILENKKD